MPFEDVAHRLGTDRQAQVGQGASNAIIPYLPPQLLTPLLTLSMGDNGAENKPKRGHW
jgi:hypothetical protein